MSRICIASHSCVGYHADAHTHTHKDIQQQYTQCTQHKLIYTFGWEAVITSRRIIINKSYLITCRLQMRSNTLAKWSENQRDGVTTTATTTTTTQIHRHRHCQQQNHIANRMKYSKGLKIWLVLLCFFFIIISPGYLWFGYGSLYLILLCYSCCCWFFFLLFVSCCFFV